MTNNFLCNFYRGLGNISVIAIEVACETTKTFIKAPLVGKAAIAASATTVTTAVSGLAYLAFRALAALTESSFIGGITSMIGYTTVVSFGAASLSIGSLFVLGIAECGKIQL